MNGRKRVGIVAESHPNLNFGNGRSARIHREFSLGFKKIIEALENPEELRAGQLVNFRQHFGHPSDDTWAAILASALLIRDLKLAGWEIESTWDDRLLTLQFTRGQPGTKDFQRSIMAPRRKQVLFASRDWISEYEAKIVPYLASGSEISLNSIEPVLQVCTTPKEHGLWRYCRMLASIPFTQHVGRRIRFLIRDASLPSMPIMAIAGIGSSLMQIGCRDE